MEINLHADAPQVARQLIGCKLLITNSAGTRGGIIIETEAYTAQDPASHSYRGPTHRNAAMFMPAGTIYIYKIYGVHLCLNIVCGNADGQAVLIRALQPTHGITGMQARRGHVAPTQLCNGPAKVVQALGLTYAFNQQPLAAAALTLTPPTTAPLVRTSPRIGISQAVDALWRFRL